MATPATSATTTVYSVGGKPITMNAADAPKGVATQNTSTGEVGYTRAPTTSAPAYSPTSNTATSYPVVTSKPATTNYNNIQSTYQNTIAPNVQAAAQANRLAQTQANQLPVMAGYDVSPTKTGKQGEAPLQTANGTYYVSPQKQPATASDLKNILSGSLPPGWDAQTYANFKAANPNLEPTPEDTAHMLAAGSPSEQAQNATGINPTTENANFTDAYKQGQNELESAYTNFNNIITQIQNGAFPLNPAQQSLVDATNQAFNQMTTQSNLKAAALSSETGGVSTKVNATAGELLNITSQQAATVAKLELGFQEQNYKMVTDSYAQFQKYETDKMNAIQKLHDNVMATYNSALDAAQKEQTRQDALKQKDIENARADDNFALEMKKYDLSVANSSVDNALKRAQAAKIYNDMKASGADLSAAQSWVKNIQSGQAKFSDVPEALKNAVSVGVANGSPQGVGAILSTTKQALDDLNSKVNGESSLSFIPGVGTGFHGAVGAKGISSFFGLKLPWDLFGISGQPMPGTAAADFDAKLKQVTNDVVLPNLTILHGLGRVTDREFQALQSSITSLSPSLSEGEFKDELKTVTDLINQKVQDAQTDTQRSESNLTTQLNSLKTTNPKLYTSASSMFTSINPETGQPYSAEDVLQAFPELAH